MDGSNCYLLWMLLLFSPLVLIKYVVWVQAYMNFRRKSTIGFSIGNILLDLLGGIANYGQMMVQSIDQRMFFKFLWLRFHHELSTYMAYFRVVQILG